MVNLVRLIRSMVSTRFDDLNRERQPCHPGPFGCLVFQVEPGGWRVADPGLRTQVVVHLGEQVRLARGHQVQVTQLPAVVAGQRRGPDQAGGPPAKQVGHHDVRQAVRPREPVRQRVRLAEAVARLVQVQPRAVGVQVDKVRGARAVHVGQPYPPLVEVVSLVQPWAAVHGHLGAEPAEADVRPVADLAVAHADQVRQAVAGHVGEIDGLLGVGEHQPWPLFLAPWVVGAPCGAEALVAERGIPGERVVAGDQHVGEAVPVEIHQAQVGIVPGDAGLRPERAERPPAALARALVDAGHRPAELGQVQVAVAGQIEQFLAVPRARHRGLVRQRAFRREPPVAEVGLVEPGAALPGKDAGQPHAVQVHPLVGPVVDPGGKVPQRAGAEVPWLVADDGLAVAELQGWQGLFAVAAGAAQVSGVRHRRHRGHAAAAGA